jgi:hypothetical protein
MSSLVELGCANLAPEFVLLLSVLMLEVINMIQKDFDGGDALSGEDQRVLSARRIENKGRRFNPSLLHQKSKGSGR